MIHDMGPVLDSPAVPEVPDADAPRMHLRPRLLVASVVALAIATLVLVWFTRPRATSPEDFAAFAGRLDSLQAPGPPFTSYDPSMEGVDLGASADSWVSSRGGTWSSTEDPHWWIAVRGWQATVSVDQAAATCRELASWLGEAGTDLGLPADGSGPGPAGCQSSLVKVGSAQGSSSDAWSDRGSQTADGQPRYRTGVLVSGGPSGGQVTVVVLADATVANPRKHRPRSGASPGRTRCPQGQTSR